MARSSLATVAVPVLDVSTKARLQEKKGIEGKEEPFQSRFSQKNSNGLTPWEDDSQDDLIIVYSITKNTIGLKIYRERGR